MFAEHLVCPVLYSLSWEVWKHRLAVPLCLLSSAPSAGSIPEQGAEPTGGSGSNTGNATVPPRCH